MDTRRHLLALVVAPANGQDRAQVEELAAAVREATGERVELAHADWGYAGEQAEAATEGHGIRLAVVGLPAAKRAFARGSRFRRLARGHEWLPETVAGLHFLAFACLLLHRLLTTDAQSP